MCGFVSMKDGAGVDDLLNEGNAVSLCLRDCREGPDLAFASNDHNAALPGLVLSKAAINPVHLLLRRPDMTTKVSAIHFDGAGKGCALDLGCDGFAKLVSENEGRFVLVAGPIFCGVSRAPAILGRGPTK